LRPVRVLRGLRVNRDRPAKKGTPDLKVRQGHKGRRDFKDRRGRKGRRDFKDLQGPPPDLKDHKET